MMESSSSSKKVKALGCAAQVISCLVDGCNSNLSQSRDYHRRHKVCELHSKTRKVTVKGQEQRFCQQCSRFHSLIEFDNEKRSCRKRLDGHNRRRRKPQPELLYRTSTNVCSDQPGSTLLSFSNPPIQPTAVGSSAWIKDVKTEDVDDTSLSYSTCNYINKHNLYHEYATQNYKAGLESVQCTSNLRPETYLFCQQLLEPNSAHGITRQKEYLDSLHRADNPSGARPLLSAEPIGTAGSSQMIHSDPGHFPLSQFFLQNMHFSGVDHFTQTKPLVSDDDVATLHFKEVCEHENRDCSTESGFQYNLSFRLGS